MKKIFAILPTIVSLIGVAFLINGCVASKIVAEKSGSQLWGETCIRCHNAPSASEYSPAQWDVIVFHMKLRANLTDDETNKILIFFKSSN